LRYLQNYFSGILKKYQFLLLHCKILRYAFIYKIEYLLNDIPIFPRRGFCLTDTLQNLIHKPPIKEKGMKKNTFLLVSIMAFVMLFCGQFFAHCQIPCGIYDDETQFTLMLEDVTTIEKSMTQITSLSKEQSPNYNQIVRWVDNKETHADKLAEIITFYFMTQRIKPITDTSSPDYAKYNRELDLLHQMLILTMKTKQTTDLQNCSDLRKLITEFKTTYTQH